MPSEGIQPDVYKCQGESEAPLFSLSKNIFVIYNMFQKKLKGTIRVVRLDPDLCVSEALVFHKHTSCLLLFIFILQN